jgi:2'-5' RNA ligase
MDNIRRQLTLFPIELNKMIERIRAEFNPVQYQLVAAHVTLCREDEIEPFEKIIKNIQSIYLQLPVKIQLNKVERFDDDKGVFISAKNSNDFYTLRKAVLKGMTAFPEKQQPHITLMHPRNSVCTDMIFAEIQACPLPVELIFDTISLMEQYNGERWNIIQQFPIVKKSVFG